jgi:hypothetical protein
VLHGRAPDEVARVWQAQTWAAQAQRVAPRPSTAAEAERVRGRNRALRRAVRAVDPQ